MLRDREQDTALAANHAASRRGGALIVDYLVFEQRFLLFGCVGTASSACSTRSTMAATTSTRSPLTTNRSRPTLRTPISACATNRWPRLPRADPGPQHRDALCSALPDSPPCSRSPGTCRLTSSTAARFRSPTATTRPISPTSSARTSSAATSPPALTMLPRILRQAMTLMTSGRPGPVNIDVPLDVFVEDAGSEGAHDPGEWDVGSRCTRTAASEGGRSSAAAEILPDAPSGR